MRTPSITDALRAPPRSAPHRLAYRSNGSAAFGNVVATLYRRIKAGDIRGSKFGGAMPDCERRRHDRIASRRPLCFGASMKSPKWQWKPAKRTPKQDIEATVLLVICAALFGLVVGIAGTRYFGW